MPREPLETTNLDPSSAAPPIPWSEMRERLEAGPLGDDTAAYLGTVRPDGRPHSAGVGPAWFEDALFFQTGPATRKGRNLARDPRCTLSVATQTFDRVVEGEAAMVTDAPTVARLADRWAEGGWPCRVDASGTALTADFSAPSAGAPPWRVYRMRVTSATALQTIEPGGATRWTFP